ncbi:MAG: O-antigen ligase family protein [Anaerolineales bacterium]
MTRIELGSFLSIENLRKAMWAFLLVSLPVTSFPFMPSFLYPETAIVRPLMLYPLAILILIDVLPSLVRGDKWPSVTLPMLLFALAAVISTSLALVNPPSALMGQTALDRAIRGIVTVAVGLATYFVCLSRMRTKKDFDRSIQWLMVGFIAAIVYGLFQYSRITLRWPYYADLNPIHQLLSVRDMHTGRVTGMAYEPSWFADQLSVLVLPLLFAGILTGYRFLGRSIIPHVLILGAAGLVLVGTYSRGGVVVSAVALMVGALLQALRHRRKMWAVIRRSFRFQEGHRLVFGLAMVILAVAILGFFIYQLSLNPYFTRLYNQLGRIDNPTAYLLGIGAGPRLGLVSASYAIYTQSPWLGVGLGQSGFYILDHLPTWLFNKENEVLEMLIPGAHVFPNPKAVWIRLLSETGIVGFALFASFILLLGFSSLRLLERDTRRAQFAGLFGIMSLIAVVLEGFSLDSFALPTWWVAFAFITATVWNADRLDGVQDE